VGVSVLAFWSGVALLLRVLAISVLIYIARLQLREMQFVSKLQPLKRLLFYFVVVIAVSNIPIVWLHWERMLGHQTSNVVTAFATVTNAGGMLITALLLALVYRYRSE
jgi:hypothetical protein